MAVFRFNVPIHFEPLQNLPCFSQFMGKTGYLSNFNENIKNEKIRRTSMQYTSLCTMRLCDFIKYFSSYIILYCNTETFSMHSQDTGSYVLCNYVFKLLHFNYDIVWIHNHNQRKQNIMYYVLISLYKGLPIVTIIVW